MNYSVSHVQHFEDYINIIKSPEREKVDLKYLVLRKK
jgi:hypothetical protein